jgi:hypothetical protein
VPRDDVSSLRSDEDTLLPLPLTWVDVWRVPIVVLPLLAYGVARFGALLNDDNDDDVVDGVVPTLPAIGVRLTATFAPLPPDIVGTTIGAVKLALPSGADVDADTLVDDDVGVVAVAGVVFFVSPSLGQTSFLALANVLT